jgi:hypothetical protein
MKQEVKFRKYLDFSRDDGATSSEEMQWTTAFIYLMKKLTLRAHRMENSGKIKIGINGT